MLIQVFLSWKNEILVSNKLSAPTLFNCFLFARTFLCDLHLNLDHFISVPFLKKILTSISLTPGRLVKYVLAYLLNEMMTQMKRCSQEELEVLFPVKD